MKIITVGGVSGVGKTTLIKVMSEKIRENNKTVKVMYEMFDESADNIQTQRSVQDDMFDTNLEIFFKNYALVDGKESSKEVMHKVLFHEILFLTNRASKSLKAVKSAEKLGIDYLIIDRTIYENRIFADTTIGQFPELLEEYDLIWKGFVKHFNSELEKFSTKHIILTASTENVLNRIKSRNREIEQGDDNDKYFSELNDLYQEQIPVVFKRANVTNYRIVNTDNKTPIELVLSILHNY